MPVRWTSHGFADANAGRQTTIERWGPLPGRDALTAIEMHHLACRMDAGVRATRGKGLQGRQRLELLDGTLQFGLNAVAIGLALPATK